MSMRGKILMLCFHSRWLPVTELCPSCCAWPRLKDSHSLSRLPEDALSARQGTTNNFYLFFLSSWRHVKFVTRKSSWFEAGASGKRLPALMVDKYPFPDHGIPGRARRFRQ